MLTSPNWAEGRREESKKGDWEREGEAKEEEEKRDEREEREERRGERERRKGEEEEGKKEMSVVVIEEKNFPRKFANPMKDTIEQREREGGGEEEEGCTASKNSFDPFPFLSFSFPFLSFSFLFHYNSI